MMRTKLDYYPMGGEGSKLYGVRTKLGIIVVSTDPTIRSCAFPKCLKRAGNDTPDFTCRHIEEILKGEDGDE